MLSWRAKSDPGLRIGRVVPEYANSTVYLSYVVSRGGGGHCGWLVVDTDLEDDWIPVYELDCPLGLDDGNGGINIFDTKSPLYNMQQAMYLFLIGLVPEVADAYVVREEWMRGQGNKLGGNSVNSTLMAPLRRSYVYRCRRSFAVDQEVAFILVNGSVCRQNGIVGFKDGTRKLGWTVNRQMSGFLAVVNTWSFATLWKMKNEDLDIGRPAFRSCPIHGR
ncbi:hypothetical protein CHS0354_010057 [Potamilus streckersoni]|uniref:Uncharacterized protein n=1 Tax=Potamilus streckersoni TaxID=2493646 RepID=A0AAE0SC94_9BIVA|nr:hypothetical protein CHS0354_010057 [Potamilus streckersoni]